jgi:hypothetical protein
MADGLLWSWSRLCSFDSDSGLSSFFLLAPIAGSVGDVVDRRKLVLFTEVWMIVAALAIAVLTVGRIMSPLRRTRLR